MARMYNDSLWLLVWNPIHGRKKPHSPLQSGFILSAACFSNRAILQVIRRRDFLLSWVCAQSSFQSCKGRSQEQKLKLPYASLRGKGWSSCSSLLYNTFAGHLVFFMKGGGLENLMHGRCQREVEPEQCLFSSSAPRCLVGECMNPHLRQQPHGNGFDTFTNRVFERWSCQCSGKLH